MPSVPVPENGFVASPPRANLVDEPTPLSALPRFAEFLRTDAAAAGLRGPVAILMKREDLMGCGLGGNKLRSLEYVIGDAVALGATDLLVGGRPQANHCRLTAAAAARCGLGAHLVLLGPRPKSPGANEVLINLLGAEVTYAVGSSPEERGELLSRIAERLLGEGRHPYLVDPPLRGPLGALGPMRAGIEAARQMSVLGSVPSRAFVAVATGTTLAGLQAGFWRAGLGMRVVGVPTHLAGAPSEAAVADKVRTVAADLLALPMSDPGPKQSSPPDVKFDSTTPWEDYAARSAPAAEAQAKLARLEGICVDPVYTARAIAAVIAWNRLGRFEDQTVLIWNGGGIPALFEP